MKTLINTVKKSRPATIIAVLALFIAIGGTATAASGLINGKNIKKGSVTAKQIKNKTITSNKLAASTINALKGARGEKGAEGEKGNTGIPGVAGPEVINTTSIDNSSNVPNNNDADIVSFNNLDSGKYLILAKAIMVANTSGGFLRCAVEANNNGGGDEAQWTAPGNVTRTTVPLMLSTTTNVTQVKINCETEDSAGFFDVQAIAIPIG